MEILLVWKILSILNMKALFLSASRTNLPSSFLSWTLKQNVKTSLKTFLTALYFQKMEVTKQFHTLEKAERTVEMILGVDLQDPSRMPMKPIPEKPGHPKEVSNQDLVLIILGRAQIKELRQKLIYVRAKELETRPNIKIVTQKAMFLLVFEEIKYQ